MKPNSYIHKGSLMVRSLYTCSIASFIIFTLILFGFQKSSYSQDTQYNKPSWLFGLSGGVNFNFYRGSTQQLNADLTVPTPFTAGNGAGLFIAPLVEFHPPDSRWGVMLKAGYDNRRGKFNEKLSPCNCPQDLSANLSYITIEPSLRFQPFKSDFYMFGGPRLAFIRSKSFIYKQPFNPDFPEQITNPDIKSDFNDVKKSHLSMQFGMGYDFYVSSSSNRMQYVFSPFISFHPYFGQLPRSIETWNVTTLRAGAAIKFGSGSINALPPKDDMADLEPKVQFTVISPRNIPVERRVRETFPLRNYVFFDIGSTEIPDRYVLLQKDQVSDFRDDQLEVFKPKKLSGRSDRQMIVYYNVLNILGDRMRKIPSSSITLVGSSEKGPEDGKLMASSIRKYLVDIFGIDSTRFSIEGRDKPKWPSEQVGGTKDLELLRECDRRVDIESSSNALLMEFQSGPNSILKPIEIIDLQQAPIDSYVTFNVMRAKDPFSSWSLRIIDKKGIIQKFGPYYQEKVSIPGKSILGNRTSGNFKVTMIGYTKRGKTIKKRTMVNMVLWKPDQREEGMRYSILYRFNSSDAIKIYHKYLTDIIIPKIPQGASVILQGYTDIVGDESSNLKLSLDRANDVRKILEVGLSKTGRGDVEIEVYGFGKDENLAPFDNKYPEGRFYNRTVIIDIIPRK